MAQFNTRNNNRLSNNNALYEMVYLTDLNGNRVSGANPSGVSVDAFGRSRISTPLTLFDSSNVGAINQKFDQALTGAATVTHLNNESAVAMNVTTAANDSVVRQSFRRFSYQPGKSLLILNTFVFAPAQTGLTQRVGYCDTSDGIFLERVDNTINLVKRSSVTGSVVETRIPQSEWSGDRLDGTGPSKKTIDLDKSHIFWMDIEWLGVGSVRCGFVIDGALILAHTFHNANIAPNVYMRTASLPIRYEINVGGSGIAAPATMKHICNSVVSEGGYDPGSRQDMIQSDLAGNSTTSTTQFMNLVTIQATSSDIVIVPSGTDILNISNADFEWGLFIDATPASTLTYTTYNSKVRYSTQAINLTSNGIRIAGGYLGGKTAPFQLGDGAFGWDYQLGRYLNGNYQTLTLAVKSASASKSAAGILKWYSL